MKYTSIKTYKIVNYCDKSTHFLSSLSQILVLGQMMATSTHCNLCSKVGIFDFPTSSSWDPQSESFASRMQKALQGAPKISHQVVTFLLGQGFSTMDFEDATSLMLQRDYPRIAGLVNDEENYQSLNGPTFVPEKYLYFNPEFIHDYELSKQIQESHYQNDKVMAGRLKRAKSDYIEQDCYSLMWTRYKSRNVTSIVFQGLTFYKIKAGKGKDQQEADFILVNLDLRAIFNVEAKTWLGSFSQTKSSTSKKSNTPNKKKSSPEKESSTIKAGKQLTLIKALMFDYFKVDLKCHWKYVSIVFCETKEDAVSKCPSCDGFVMNCNDFAYKMEAIEKMLQSENVESDHSAKIQNYYKDFVVLAKYLLYLAPKMELPTTTAIHSKITKAMEKIGSIANIKVVAFPDPEQRQIFSHFENDKYKLVLFGSWGSGKTTLMMHYAKQLALQGKKVLFLVLKAGNAVASDVKPFLELHLERFFQNLQEFVKVQSISITDGLPSGLIDLTKEFNHVFVDEFFGDLDLLEPQTLLEVLSMLNDKETAAIALSNSYFNDVIPRLKATEGKLKELLKNFKFLKMRISLRSPANISQDLKSLYEQLQSVRDLQLNEHLMLQAKIPPRLTEGLPTLKVGFDHRQLISDVVLEGFKHVPAEQSVFVIINDRPDNPILKEVMQLIPCDCKDIIMYLSLDLALEKAGKMEKSIHYHCLQYQSSSSNYEEKDVIVTSVELIKGFETSFLFDLSNMPEMQSRSTGRIIIGNPHWSQSMKNVVRELLDEDHICSNMMDRRLRQLDQERLFENVTTNGSSDSEVTCMHTGPVSSQWIRPFLKYFICYVIVFGLIGCFLIIMLDENKHHVPTPKPTPTRELIAIANGYTKNGSTPSIEVIDLQGHQCQDLGIIDQGLMGAVGQVWDSNSLVLCGGLLYGQSTSYKCFQVDRDGTRLLAVMSEKRNFAASVPLNSKEIWILGGRDATTDISSTEKIMSNKKVKGGPNMPSPLEKHTFTQITDDMFLLAGGYSNDHGSSNEAFIFHTKNQSWTQAPYLIRTRHMHSASIITDKFTGEKHVVITGGLPIRLSGFSTEYISIKDLTRAPIPYTSAKWSFGATIPFGNVSGHATLSWEDDILLIGGEHDTYFEYEYLKSIYRLSLNNSIFTWTNVTQKLRIGRRSFVALKIPESMATCKEN